MSDRLPQLIVDAKTAGVYDLIAGGDGRLHPNTERAMLDGCTFDLAAAEHVMQFYTTLLRIPWPRGTQLNDWERQWIGRYMPRFDFDLWTPTKPFVLLRWWYEKVLAQLFGWKRKDGRRRFDKGFMTTSKKSGKSTTLSGLPLYMAIADNEEEAEAYAAAVDRAQASIIFSKADKMVRQSPHLAKILRRVPSQKRISFDPKGSYFEAISHDADSAEGKNPHLLIADELHAWRGRKFFDSLMYGDIARTQPLFLMITTAGDDDLSVGYEEYQFASELLDPENDFYSMTHFAFIAEAGRDPVSGLMRPNIEESDTNYEWDDPSSWEDAGPSLAEGVGSVAKLQTKCDEAKTSPAKKLSFIRYICNRWVTSSHAAWLNREYWRNCGDKNLQIPDGVDLFLGADLARIEDLVAIAKAWWIKHDLLGVKCDFYMPREGVQEKAERWRVPLQQWIDEGWIRLSGDRVVDWADLRWEISGVALDENGSVLKERNPDAIDQVYSIRELAFDRYMAMDLIIKNLGDNDGIEVVEHGQGFASMSNPSKAFKKRIDTGRLVHDCNPVMDWMVGHCVVDEDPAENVKPNKKKSRHKIDGIVAEIMAAGRAESAPLPKESVYTRRGVLTF
jgi:phage terminase large subunit-like protein